MAEQSETRVNLLGSMLTKVAWKDEEFMSLMLESMLAEYQDETESSSGTGSNDGDDDELADEKYESAMLVFTDKSGKMWQIKPVEDDI